jgi:fructose-bisphosphate aldolase class 1
MAQPHTDKQALMDTARALVAADKCLLAMDKSNSTCNRRFVRNYHEFGAR